MRVRQSDEARLVMVDFPWGLVGIGALPVVFCIVVAVDRVLHGWRPDDARFVLVLLVLVALFAAFPVFLAARTVFSFDLLRRELTWSRRSLWSRRGGTIAFACIKGAAVSYSSEENGRAYRVELSTTSQGILPLASYSGNTFGIHARRCQRIAGMINAVLQTDGEAATKDSIVGMVGRGETAEAIRLAAKRYGYDRKQAESFVRGLLK